MPQEGGFLGELLENVEEFAQVAEEGEGFFEEFMGAAEEGEAFVEDEFGGGGEYGEQEMMQEEMQQQW